MKIVIIDQSKERINKIKGIVSEQIDVLECSRDVLKDINKDIDLVLIHDEIIFNIDYYPLLDIDFPLVISYGNGDYNLIRKIYSCGINHHVSDLDKLNDILNTVKNTTKTNYIDLPHKLNTILDVLLDFYNRTNYALKAINTVYDAKRTSLIYIENDYIRHYETYDKDDGKVVQNMVLPLSSDDMMRANEYAKMKVIYSKGLSGLISSVDESRVDQADIHEYVFVPMTVNNQMFYIAIIDPKKYSIDKDDELFEVGRILESKLNLHNYLTGIQVDKPSGLYNVNSLSYLFQLHSTNWINPYLICIKIVGFDKYTEMFTENDTLNMLTDTGNRIKEIFKDCKYFASRRTSNSNFIICVDNVDIDLNYKVEKIIEGGRINQATFIAVIYKINDKSENIYQIEQKTNNVAYDKNISIYQYEDIEVVNSDEILKDFKEAIDNNDIVTYIQPKYDTKLNKYYGGEALARWVKKDGTFVSPQMFVPVLEEAGYIQVLDKYIILQVLKMLREWIDNDLDVVPISINLSQYDFLQDTLFEEIIDLIDNYNIPHNLIQFEITETAFVNYDKYIKSFILKCKKTGILILMDDFGSGYSSLNSLKDMDLDIIKLDCNFLTKSSNVDKKNRIIASIISMIRLLNISTVAEGVETQEDSDLLYQMGLYHIQGYLYGKPMPKDEFEKILNNSVSFSYKFNNNSLILDDLFNPHSNGNIFLSCSIVPSFVVKYDANECLFVLKNVEADKLIERYNLDDNDVKSNEIIFNLLKRVFDNFIDGNINEYRNRIKDRKISGNLTFSGRINIRLIAKFDSDAYFYIELIEDNDNFIGFKYDEIDTLYKDVDLITFIVYDNKIIYYNKACKDEMEYISRCNDFPDFLNYYNIKKLLLNNNYISYGYINALKANCQIYRREIIFQGEKALLFTINLRAKLTMVETDTHRLRLIDSISKSISFYNEINVSDNTYLLYNFTSDNLQLPLTGTIEQLYHYMFNHCSVDDKFVVNDVFKLDSYEKVKKTRIIKTSINDRYYKHYVVPYEKEENKYINILSFDITDEKDKTIDKYTGFYNYNFFKVAVSNKINNSANVNHSLLYFKISNVSRLIYGYTYNKYLDFIDLLASKIKTYVTEGNILVSRFAIDAFGLFYEENQMKNDHLVFISMIENDANEILKDLGVGIKIHLIYSLVDYPKDGKTLNELFSKTLKNIYIKENNLTE